MRSQKGNVNSLVTLVQQMIYFKSEKYESELVIIASEILSPKWVVKDANKRLRHAEIKWLMKFE